MFGAHPETCLIPYLRGELAGGERERIAAHLEGCAACRTQTDDLARTLRLAAEQLEHLPAPEWMSYRAELRRKLAERENRASGPGRWRPTFVWGSFAAAGLAVALMAVTLLRPGNPKAPLLAQPSVEALALADPDLDEIGRTGVNLLRDYPMVERLDMLDDENYDVIEHLDELAPSIQQTHEIQRS